MSFRSAGRKQIHVLMPGLVVVFLSSAEPFACAADESSESRLRRVEERIGRPRAGARDPAQEEEMRREQEQQRRLESEREQWKRRHPGEQLPPRLEDSQIDMDDVSLVIFMAPFAIPKFILDDDYRIPCGYLPYPFASGDGLTDPDGRSWMAGGSVSSQLVSDNIHGIRTDATVAFWRRFAFEAAYTKYEERLRTRQEFLSLAEGLVTFVFAQNETWNFRGGVGVESIDGRHQYRGVKWAYRIRWFHRPVHVDLDFGFTSGLGASTLSEVTPGIGWHLGRSEIRAGYRRLKISGERLHGPELSVRLWF